MPFACRDGALHQGLFQLGFGQNVVLGGFLVFLRDWGLSVTSSRPLTVDMLGGSC